MTTKGPYTPRRKCLLTRLADRGGLEPFVILGNVALWAGIAVLVGWWTLR